LSDSQWLVRHIIPRPPFKLSSGFLLSCSTPLLEEEGHARIQAPVADFGDPRRVHRAGSKAGLTAQIHPNPAADDI